jgi:hypothetical protein
MDEKGRCCGRKPIVYKRWPHRGYFCCSFDLETKEQQDNFAWKKNPDGSWEKK